MTETLVRQPLHGEPRRIPFFCFKFFCLWPCCRGNEARGTNNNSGMERFRWYVSASKGPGAGGYWGKVVLPAGNKIATPALLELVGVLEVDDGTVISELR